MKYFIIFWLIPVGGLASWLWLSSNDLSFGLPFLSRDMHDLVFGIYGQMLGIDPATLPPLVWRALVVDTLLILAILAFRKRREIRAWFASRRESEMAAAAE